MNTRNWLEMFVRLEGYLAGKLELPPYKDNPYDVRMVMHDGLIPIGMVIATSMTHWMQTRYQGGPILIHLHKYCCEAGIVLDVFHLEGVKWKGEQDPRDLAINSPARTLKMESFVAALIARLTSRELPEGCDIIAVPLDAARN